MASSSSPTTTRQQIHDAQTADSNAPIYHSRWVYKVLELYCQERIFSEDVRNLSSEDDDASVSPSSVTGVADSETEFDRFWSWMMNEDVNAHDMDDSSSSIEVPLAQVSIHNELREEVHALFVAHDFFSHHDTKWWMHKLTEFEAEHRLARQAAYGAAMRGKPDSRRLRERARKGQQAREIASSGENSSSEKDWDMLDGSNEDDEGAGGLGFGRLGGEDFDVFDEDAMDVDEVEVDDEGIEDISSDEDFYGKRSRVLMTRADSHQDV